MDTATYTLLMDFGEGYEDFSDRIIMAESYKPRICIGKAGTHEIQTVQLKLHQAAGIAARLLTATDPIPAKLLRLGTPVMTGIVRPFVSTKALLNRMAPISISILDMSATLEQYVFDSQRWTNLTLINRTDITTSLIHKLFAEAGIPSADVLVDFDRSEIIPCYSLSNGDYISDRIQEALYEYGLTYRATENGQYRILDISQDTIIPDVILYSEDLRNELLPSRNDSSQKGAIVKWYPVLTRSQVPVFAYEFTEETEELPANGVFPPSSDIKDYRLPYDISELTDGKLLAIANPVLSYKPNTLKAYAITDFGPDDCSAYLVSTSSSKQTVSEFQVLADVWYQGRTYSQQVAQGKKPKTYTAKVISDAGSAQRLARILATRQTVGQQQYSFESFVFLSPGQLVRIYEYKVTHIDITVRILSREYDSISGLYRYSAEGATDIDLTIPVTEIETIENALGKGRPGPQGKGTISVQIFSSNGNIFRDGECYTTMSAIVWRGNDNITDELDSSLFSWERTSSDSIADKSWNSSSKAIGRKVIDLTPEDVFGRSVFACHVNL